MRPLPPCNQCPDRRVGCHDPAVCARWAAYDEANRDFREACRADWERLKAYEDTGLTPERCAELAEADRDGRLVVLPCKVCVHIWINGREAVILKFFGFKNERYFEAQFFDTQQYIALAFDEIGKTVFLTREEAEQALKEAKDDG